MDSYAIFVVDQLIKDFRAEYEGTARPPSRPTTRRSRLAAIRGSVHGLADRVGHTNLHAPLTEVAAGN